MHRLKVMGLIVSGALLLFIGINSADAEVRLNSEVFHLPLLDKQHPIVGNDQSDDVRY